MRSHQGFFTLAIALSPWIMASSCIGDVVSSAVNSTAEEIGAAVNSSSGAAIAEETGFSSKSAIPPAGAQPYGADGTLGEVDIKAVLYLSWPQKYESIIDRFGYPASRNETQDFYQIPNGRWLAINYSGRTAIGYSLSDSQ